MDITERVASALHARKSKKQWEDEPMSVKRRYLREAKMAVNITMGVLGKVDCDYCGEAVA